jgi:hypothetical protein
MIRGGGCFFPEIGDGHTLNSRKEGNEKPLAIAAITR